MQVIYNTCFGQLWKDRGDTQDPDTLLERREIYEAELPELAKIAEALGAEFECKFRFPDGTEI